MLVSAHLSASGDKRLPDHSFHIVEQASLGFILPYRTERGKALGKLRMNAQTRNGRLRESPHSPFFPVPAVAASRCTQGPADLPGQAGGPIPGPFPGARRDQRPFCREEGASPSPLTPPHPHPTGFRDWLRRSPIRKPLRSWGRGFPGMWSRTEQAPLVLPRFPASQRRGHDSAGRSDQAWALNGRVLHVQRYAVSSPSGPEGWAGAFVD